MDKVERNLKISAFSGQDIISKFHEMTGFKFDPTVPGQLLARSGIKKIGIHTSSRKAVYDGALWTPLWFGMFKLAKNRCFYDKTLNEPTFLPIDEIFSACPHYKRFEIKRDVGKDGGKQTIQKNHSEALKNYQKEMDDFIKNIAKM